jgi:superfamily II DNA or RNA helicase
MQTLRACQKEAVDKFDNYFYEYNDGENDRGIISMCCGSGKSRTSYEIIKLCIRKHKKKFFVVATSRVKLIYQLAKDYIKWSKLEKMNMTIKVIGGNGEEYRNITISNVDEIKSSVKSYVCHDCKPLLLITTYNSCNKIIQAVDGESSLYPDLIILDEAHNTTGDNSKLNQSLIEKGNDKFSAEKYLFMTATPVALILKDKNSVFQNNETVYSMGNKKIYGDFVYEYSFHRGFSEKPPILVPFEIIRYHKKDEIPEDIKKELQDKNKIEKQQIYFKTISNFLIDSIRDYQLKHVLVYLKNKEKIEVMNKILEKIISEKKFEYVVTSIFSEQTKKVREENLKKFRNSGNECNILLSVGIFDEGVDEPCIDAVMFAEERNTQTRIVQNIGRCLRIDPNNKNKKKGYVLIPNIVYEFNDEDSDEEVNISKSYSSHFKMIRHIASVLKKDVKNHFYKKYVKGNIPDSSDEDDNDANDLCDNYAKNNKIECKKLIDIDYGNTYDLSIYFVRECTSGDINNEELETIKTITKKFKIDTVRKYGDFAREHKIPYIYLHNEFKTEWISWGQFLHEKTFTYQQAKEFILKNYNGKINESKEWVDYYNTVLAKELDNKRDEGVNDELISGIIKIPNRPKEFYKSDWIDWNDFLSLVSDNEGLVGFIKTTAEEDSKADKNIKVLMNNDHERISRLIKGDYNDIELKRDLSEIKKYIDTQLGVDCILQTRVSLKKNGNFDKCCIQCRPKENDRYTIPIIIYPEENKFKYDHENLNTKKLVRNSKMNRTKEIFIQNPKILKQFEEIIEECKKFVQDKKKNGEVNDPECANKNIANKSTEDDNDIDDFLDEFKRDNEVNKAEERDRWKKGKHQIVVRGKRQEGKESRKAMIKRTYK